MKISCIGDISKNDIKLLCKYAKVSDRIIEFGSGGSTQVFAHFKEIISLETEDIWINITKTHIESLGLIPTKFMKWDDRKFEGIYDLVFNDGLVDLRFKFFNEVFPFVKIGGKILIHDTRGSSEYINQLCDCIKPFYNEISNISINEDDSNITVLTKCALMTYENWNIIEGKEQWEFTQSTKPDNWKKVLKGTEIQI